MPSTTAPDEPAELDAVFGALANPTRRALVTRLGVSEATISELAEPLAMTLPAVSKHLRVLEDAGLVTRRRVGRARRCALRREALGEAEAWFGERRAFWEASLDSLSGFLAAGPSEEER